MSQEASSGREYRPLREAEVELSKGQSVAQVCKRIGITEQTYYRWRKEYWRSPDGSSQADERP